MIKYIKLIALCNSVKFDYFDIYCEIIKDEYYYTSEYPIIHNLKSYHIYDMNDKYNGWWNSENFITEVEYRNRLIKEILE